MLELKTWYVLCPVVTILSTFTKKIYPTKGLQTICDQSFLNVNHC